MSSNSITLKQVTVLQIMCIRNALESNLENVSPLRLKRRRLDKSVFAAGKSLKLGHLLIIASFAEWALRPDYAAALNWCHQLTLAPPLHQVHNRIHLSKTISKHQ
jgi:hypothetical protein